MSKHTSSSKANDNEVHNTQIRDQAQLPLTRSTMISTVKSLQEELWLRQWESQDTARPDK